MAEPKSTDSKDDDQVEATATPEPAIDKERQITFSTDESSLVAAVYIDDTHPPKLAISGLEITTDPVEKFESGAAQVFSRVLVARGGKTEEFTSGIGESSCVEMIPSTHLVWRNEESAIVDARVRCYSGSVVSKERTMHLVIRIDVSEGAELNRGVSVLFTGKDLTTSNRGLTLESLRHEFYVEGGEFVVYQHSVSWCDEKAIKESGEGLGCSEHRRRLVEIERLAI
ncbi:hypothetical protein [Enhygromyxa salina]|nr:hypothetical protein [Enhygromyxa salina]